MVKKRFLSLLLVLVMVLGFLPGKAMAEGPADVLPFTVTDASGNPLELSVAKESSGWSFTHGGIVFVNLPEDYEDDTYTITIKEPAVNYFMWMDLFIDGGYEYGYWYEDGVETSFDLSTSICGEEGTLTDYYDIGVTDWDDGTLVYSYFIYCGIQASPISDTIEFSKNLKTYETVALNTDLTLSVEAQAYEIVTYQWRQSADMTNWDNITDAVYASYAPATSAEGITYYKVAATGGGTTLDSNVATVTVLPAAADVSAAFGFSAQDGPLNCTVYSNPALTAAGSGGTAWYYEWFKDNERQTGGSSTTTFYADTCSEGTHPYYCIASVDGTYFFESDHIEVNVEAATPAPPGADVISVTEDMSSTELNTVSVAGVGVSEYSLGTSPADCDRIYNIQLAEETADDTTFTLYFECVNNTNEGARGNLPVLSSVGAEQGISVTDQKEAIAEASFRTLTIQLEDGSAQAVVYSYTGSRSYSRGARLKYIFNFTIGSGSEAALLMDAEPVGGQWLNKSGLFSQNAANLAVPYGAVTAQVNITAQPGVEISINDGEAQSVNEEGFCTVTLNSSAQGTVNTILAAKDDMTGHYTVTCYTQKYSGMPDLVTDYLCIGSQYTNGLGISDYGLRGVATLLGSMEDAIVLSTSGPASLGNYGGYIVYYFENAITDDPKNPYGVDFITYGNSVEGSNAFAEPGQVWVSEDGTDWYALAGSVHYDSSTRWDYSITYAKLENGRTSWQDNLGNSVTQPYYEYPLKEYYPLFDWTEALESNMTLNGILLRPQEETNEFGNILPPFTDFGYTDVGIRGDSNQAGNPYSGSFTKPNRDRLFLSTTDGMDLAWAVDENGQPAAFENGVHYVKIVTASNIDNGTIGEKSTEVNMVRVAAAGSMEAGQTAAPSAITVDGAALTLESGKYIYDHVTVDGPFAVTVDTAENTNIYINSIRGDSVVFSGMPLHGMVRIILQEGEKEPVIYYLNLEASAGEPETTATLTLDPNGGTLNGSTASSNYTFDAHMSGIVLPVPSAPDDSFEFSGWYSYGQKLYTTYPFELEDLTLTANWKKKAGSPETPSDNINVTFRLIGCTLADLEDEFDTIDLADGNYKGAKYVTWIATTPYAMEEGDTVRDLFIRALDDAGMYSEGASAGYVRTIYAPSICGDYALSEFTNGKRSGWMYTINGSHPLLALTEQTLSDGDVVIWHYVNDYAYEVEDWDELGGSGWPKQATNGTFYDKWLEAADVRPTSSSSNLVNQTTEGSTTLIPAVTASGGKAAVNISASDLTDAIKSAKDNGGKQIVIAPEITGTATKVTVELPKASLSSIVSETDVDLTVETPVGTMTIPNAVLGIIASQASGSTVTVSLNTVETSSLTETQRSAVGDKPVYDISIMSGGSYISSFGSEGSITVSLPYTLNSGENASGVTVWYLNDKGELQEMTCAYDNGVATFTTTHLSYFVVGYSEVRINPEVWTNPFTDVKTTDWYYDAVKYAVQKELFSGTSTTTFSPNDNMTRAMLVTVLHRLNGKSVITSTNSFTDVQNGQWYTDAVMWASANNIVSGYGDGLFGTNDNVTREQMTAILYRYAEHKGYDVTKTSGLEAYTDAANVSVWAAPAMKWAKSEGLIAGIASSTLAPSGNATRAQVATILQNFCENVVK